MSSNEKTSGEVCGAMLYLQFNKYRCERSAGHAGSHRDVYEEVDWDAPPNEREWRPVPVTADVPAKRCTACGEPTDDKPECSERCFGIAHPRPASASPKIPHTFVAGICSRCGLDIRTGGPWDKPVPACTAPTKVEQAKARVDEYLDGLSDPPQDLHVAARAIWHRWYREEAGADVAAAMTSDDDVDFLARELADVLRKGGRRVSASDSRELEIERNKRVSAERKLREMPIGDRRRAERLVKDVEVLTLALHASGDMLKHQLASAYESLAASRKAESRLAKTVARYRGRETGSPSNEDAEPWAGSRLWRCEQELAKARAQLDVIRNSANGEEGWTDQEPALGLKLEPSPRVYAHPGHGTYADRDVAWLVAEVAIAGRHAGTIELLKDAFVAIGALPIGPSDGLGCNNCAARNDIARGALRSASEAKR